jgi:hypothetical protein
LKNKLKDLENPGDKTTTNSNKSIYTEVQTPKQTLIINNLSNINNNINLSARELNQNHNSQFCIYPNSLITISKEVFKFLSDMERVNIKTLNDTIISKISNSEKKSESLTEKNIQRRVYDAINVMNAIGLIKKEKSILNFQGKMDMKNFEAQKNSAAKFKEEIEKKKNEIKEKKEKLLTFYTKVFNANYYFN